MSPLTPAFLCKGHSQWSSYNKRKRGQQAPEDVLTLANVVRLIDCSPVIVGQGYPGKCGTNLIECE